MVEGAREEERAAWVMAEEKAAAPGVATAAVTVVVVQEVARGVAMVVATVVATRVVWGVATALSTASGEWSIRRQDQHNRRYHWGHSTDRRQSEPTQGGMWSAQILAMA